MRIPNSLIITELRRFCEREVGAGELDAGLLGLVRGDGSGVNDAARVGVGRVSGRTEDRHE